MTIKKKKQNFLEMIKQEDLFVLLLKVCEARERPRDVLQFLVFALKNYKANNKRIMGGSTTPVKYLINK